MGGVLLSMCSTDARMSENAFINAEPIAHDHRRGENGQRRHPGPGRRFGGWSLYVKDASRCTRKLFWVCRNTTVQGLKLAAGKLRSIRVVSDGGGVGKGGMGTILVNGKKVARVGSNKPNVACSQRTKARRWYRRGHGGECRLCVPFNSTQITKVTSNCNRDGGDRNRG